MYQRYSHVEHILKRPDTYVGSLPSETSQCWVRKDNKFELRTINVSPGLVKIFDEILVNAIDQHTLHPKKVTRIDVSWDADAVTVRNNGDGIPIKMHDKEKVWLPELIFGHLLTSSNYDDTKELGTRNIKVALRRLRRFAREGAATELDLPGTIRSNRRITSLSNTSFCSAAKCSFIRPYSRSAGAGRSITPWSGRRGSSGTGS